MKTKTASNPIDTTNNFIKNGIENIGNEAGKEIKEIIENAGEAAEDKCKGIKAKLIGFCNFLRHAGVALGTALGVVAGFIVRRQPQEAGRAVHDRPLRAFICLCPERGRQEKGAQDTQ